LKRGDGREKKRGGLGGGANRSQVYFSGIRGGEEDGGKTLRNFDYPSGKGKASWGESPGTENKEQSRNGGKLSNESMVKSGNTQVRRRARRKQRGSVLTGEKQTEVVGQGGGHTKHMTTDFSGGGGGGGSVRREY